MTKAGNVGDERHFEYTGNIVVSKGMNAEVVGVRFLTPAVVTVKSHGETRDYTVGVDLVNRKAYDGGKESWLSGRVFEYLDRVNTLPEDFFAAPDHIADAAAEARAAHDRMNQDHLGAGTHGRSVLD